MTTEQQIKQAIKEVSPQTRVSGYNIGWRGGFLAGASFYREQILPGVMEKFAEWIDKNGWVKTDAGHWSDEYDNRYTLEQVITEFLSHLKQKDDVDTMH